MHRSRYSATTPNNCIVRSGASLLAPLYIYIYIYLYLYIYIYIHIYIYIYNSLSLSLYIYIYIYIYTYSCGPRRMGLVLRRPVRRVAAGLRRRRPEPLLALLFWLVRSILCACCLLIIFFGLSNYLPSKPQVSFCFWSDLLSLLVCSAHLECFWFVRSIWSVCV